MKVVDYGEKIMKIWTKLWKTENMKQIEEKSKKFEILVEFLENEKNIRKF